MDALCLQDWITIKADPEISSLAQPSSGWLDVSLYEDLVFFLDVKEADGTPQVTYQTAPAAEESAFLTVISTPVLSGPVGRADAALTIYSPVPTAKFVRWMLSSQSPPWAITFRIWIAAYFLP
jgi:hypothetical protein